MSEPKKKWYWRLVPKNRHIDWGYYQVCIVGVFVYSLIAELPKTYYQSIGVTLLCIIGVESFAKRILPVILERVDFSRGIKHGVD